MRLCAFGTELQLVKRINLGVRVAPPLPTATILSGGLRLMAVTERSLSIGAVASDTGAHDDLYQRWIEDRPARRVIDVHDGANQIDHRIAFHERMVTS